MSINDNRWSDKFDFSKLEGEDWLVPDSKVLGNIEAQIHGPDKWRKGFLFWLMSAGVLLIGICSLYVLNDSSNKSELSVKQSLVSIKGNSEKANLNEISSEVAIANDSEKQESIVHQSISLSSDNQASTLVSVVPNLQQEPSSTNEKTSMQAYKPKSFFNTPIRNQGPLHNRIVTSKKQSEPSQILPEISSKNKSILSLSTTTPEIFSSTKNDYKDYSERLLFSAIEVDQEKSRNRFFAEIATGSIRFILNDNFNSAVSPAGFFSRDGEVQSGRLGYKLPLDSKFNLALSIGYDRIDFISGHNSNVEYLLTEETNQSNLVELGLATPLGFISGEALISRESNVDENLTNLLVDLTNAHQFQTVNFSALISYKLLEKSNISLNIEGGLGVKRIFGVKNQLIDLQVNNAAFESQVLTITRDQDAINKTLLDLTLGAAIEKEFAKGFRTGIFYNYNSSLTTLYSIQSNSTTYQSNKLGLRVTF